MIGSDTKLKLAIFTTRRRLFASVFLLAVLAGLAGYFSYLGGVAEATPTLTQIVPFSSSGSYTYQNAYINVPNVSLSSGQFVGDPNGVTNWSGTFIESGGTYDCYHYSCPYDMPYVSYQTNGGPRNEVALTDTNLLAGGRYRFYVIHISGSTNWQGVWCGSSCGGIATVDLGTTTLPYAASGIESYPYGTSVGTVTTNSNQYYTSAGYYNYWCYNAVATNVGTGYWTACNSGSHSWSITY